MNAASRACRPRWPVAVLALVLACGPAETPAGRPLAIGTEPSDRAVWSGLVPLTESAEPQWDQRATLTERMRHYRAPGVGVALIDGYEVAWSEGIGVVRAGGGQPVTPGTLFHAGSIAKCLSAAVALALVEEGLLSLDGDVDQWLTSWQLPESEQTHREPVTLRRLLSHSAGIEDGFTNRSSADAVPDYFRPEGEGPTVTLQELLDAAPGVDVDGPTRVTAVPGSRYRYANADYAILELLVRDVTGEPFADLMADRVLEPLGMGSSTYRQPLPAELRARAAVEHDLRGRPIAGDRLHVPLVAAGGLWATPTDLARFAVEILRAYRGDSDLLLSRAMAREMLAPQIEMPDNPLAETAGLGFELAGEGTGFYIEHTGGTWGSTAILWAYPETGQGAVIMTNSASGSLLRIEILLGLALEHGWQLD